MWFFALTTLVVIIASIVGFTVLKNMKERPIWLTTDGETTSAPDDGKSSNALAMNTNREACARSNERMVGQKNIWEDGNYCWVVVCKNDSFHRRLNVYNVHRIPLGETDAAIPSPPVFEPFVVRCNECGKDYLYKPLEVLRYEMEVPSSFVPHKLFRE